MCSHYSIIHIREPFNFWSHILWTFTCLIILLIHPRRTDIKFIIFLLSMILCYGLSSLYHGVTKYVDLCRELDYIGIFTLIAGTYTPLLRQWKFIFLVWVNSLLGILLQIYLTDAPSLVTVLLYLMIGWGTSVLLPNIGNQCMKWLLLGGVSYSIGALFNVLSYHELSHVWAILGSIAHIICIAHVTHVTRMDRSDFKQLFTYYDCS